MSKRLQIILPDDEYQAVAQAARRQGKPVARVVRESIRRMLSEEGEIEQRIAAVLNFARSAGPTGDIDQILAEIERGRSVSQSQAAAAHTPIGLPRSHFPRFQGRTAGGNILCGGGFEVGRCLGASLFVVLVPCVGALLGRIRASPLLMSKAPEAVAPRVIQ